MVTPRMNCEPVIQNNRDLKKSNHKAELCKRGILFVITLHYKLRKVSREEYLKNLEKSKFVLTVRGDHAKRYG